MLGSVCGKHLGSLRVAAVHVKLLKLRMQGAQTKRVGASLSAVAVQHDPARLRGQELASDQRRHRNRAQLGQLRTVDQRLGGGRLRIHQDVEPLRTIKATLWVRGVDRHELRPNPLWRLGGHEHQIAVVLQRQRTAREIISRLDVLQ